MGQSGHLESLLHLLLSRLIPHPRVRTASLQDGNEVMWWRWPARRGVPARWQLRASEFPSSLKLCLPKVTGPEAEGLGPRLRKALLPEGRLLGHPGDACLPRPRPVQAQGPVLPAASWSPRPGRAGMCCHLQAPRGTASPIQP